MKKEGKMEEFYDRSKETMPLEERKRYFDEKAKWVVDYAYRNSAGMRERLDKAGIDPSQVSSVDDLMKIPVLPKSEFLQMQRANPPFGGCLTVPLQSLPRVCISPGPIYDAIGDSEVEAMARIFYAAGVRSEDIVIISFSYHLVPAGTILDDAVRRLGATVIPAGVGNSELQLQIMRELGVTAYVGTGSFLINLIKKAEELGYNFRRDFSLQRALLSAEMLPSSLRMELEQDYQINVVDPYGTADIGFIAYECSQKSGKHIVEEVIVEIVDPTTGKRLGPGEVGEVVITTLNKYYPLIRLGTGDISSYTDEPCPCGRTSNRLVRIMGRVGYAVKLKGMFLYDKQVEATVSKFPEIARAQAVINRIGNKDEITLKLELKDEGIDKEKLSQAVQDSAREACRLKMDKIEFLAKGEHLEEPKIIVDKRVWE